MSNATGTIVQTIGAVIDIEFPRDAMPGIYDALVLESSDNALVEQGLTFEVEQQLGDGVVRTIALGSADGLQRGMRVKNTGSPISVPVGPGVLGRVMDVLGRPIDERGPIDSKETRSIHQPAPKFDELSPSTELLETGHRDHRSEHDDKQCRHGLEPRRGNFKLERMDHQIGVTIGKEIQ